MNLMINWKIKRPHFFQPFSALLKLFNFHRNFVFVIPNILAISVLIKTILMVLASNFSKTEKLLFFGAFFRPLCGPECAQSTNLKIYRMSHLNFLIFGILNLVTSLCNQLLQKVKLNFDFNYIGNGTLFLYTL